MSAVVEGEKVTSCPLASLIIGPTMWAEPLPSERHPGTHSLSAQCVHVSFEPAGRVTPGREPRYRPVSLHTAPRDHDRRDGDPADPSSRLEHQHRPRQQQVLLPGPRASTLRAPI